MCYTVSAMKKTRDCFRVLILAALHTVAGRKKFSGINRFLGEGAQWDFELLRSDTDFTPERMAVEMKKDYDGMLILVPQAPSIMPALKGCRIPIVFTSGPSTRLDRDFIRAVFIREDVRNIVKTGINHLLSLPQIAALGFVPTRTPEPWSDERCRAFRALTSRGVVPAQVFEGDGDDLSALTEWLRQLPRPAGVIAAFDDRGRDVLEAARKGGIRIPAELSVLGIGNDEPICETARPPLSSVAIDFAQEGYRAARELQAMMLRRIRPYRREIPVGANDLVVRGSTDSPVKNAALVRRALKFIDQRACDRLEVDDVVAYMRVSRRLAYLRFAEVAGCSILRAILARRIDRAKRLLETTDLPIAEIALRCGYKDNNYFKNAFRRETRHSPSDWRKRRQRTASRLPWGQQL